jgi:hypothetical protein
MPVLEILRENDIAPDGVRMAIDWGQLVVGSSVFVPCIDTDSAIKQLSRVFLHHKWLFRHSIRAENGRMGVRIWRTG